MNLKAVEQIIDSVIAAAKFHIWIPSASNSDGDAIEQKCGCGVYRHRFHYPMLGWSAWIDGEHPSAHLHRRRAARGFPDGYCP